MRANTLNQELLSIQLNQMNSKINAGHEDMLNLLSKEDGKNDFKNYANSCMHDIKK